MMLPTVRGTLNANSAVAELVEDRIYRHGEAPEGVVAPYITWFLVVGAPENVLDGLPPVDRCEIQVDCWSDNGGDGDAEIEELAEAVRNALEPEHHMTGVLVNGKDPETRRYRIGMGFTWFLSR